MAFGQVYSSLVQGFKLITKMFVWGYQLPGWSGAKKHFTAEQAENGEKGQT